MLLKDGNSYFYQMKGLLNIMSGELVNTTF